MSRRSSKASWRTRPWRAATAWTSLAGASRRAPGNQRNGGRGIVMFAPQDIDLKYYSLLVRRRRKVIVGTAVGFILAAVILNVVTQPVYRASVRIEVRKEPSRSPLTGEAIASYSWNSDNVALYTAAELITNRALLREV